MPGLRDLPHGIQSDFRNTFIRHIMKLIFSNTLPWNNPSLSVCQQEFNLVYSTSPRYCLHMDDAVVIPVTISNINKPDINVLTSPTPQTNCGLGVLRNQIGAEALAAVIDHLPTQYNKRMLDSVSKRAAYVVTLLGSTQRPFIWEYFRPGTIEVPRGEETYYDEVSPHLSHVPGYSYHRTPEASRSFSVNSCSPCLLGVLFIIWHSDAIPIRRFWTSNWFARTCSRCGELNFFFLLYIHSLFLRSNAGISCTAVVTT